MATESQFIPAQPNTWSVTYQAGKFYVTHRIVAWEILGSAVYPWHAYGQCKGHDGVWCDGLMERKGTSVEYVRYGLRLVQPGTADEQEVKPKTIGDMFREHNERMSERMTAWGLPEYR